MKLKVNKGTKQQKIQFVAGLGCAGVACAAWNFVPGNQTFDTPSNPLAFIEPYHWGLASAIIGKKVKKVKKYRYVFYGVGAGLVTSELAGSQPLGIGKPVEQLVPNAILGGLLLTILLKK